MLKLPLVSILVAAYNRHDLLKKCLESAINQTYKNIEIIVIDDGSTEDLTDLYGMASIFIHTEKKGCSHARNLAMKEASGDFYLVLDSDDILLPDCVERTLAKIIKEDADMAFSDLTMIDIEDNVIGTWKSEIQTFADCMGEKKIPHPSLMLRASFVGDTEYCEQWASAVDYDFTLALLLKNPKMVRLDEPTTLYRVHAKQETLTEPQIESAANIRKKYEKYLHCTA